MSKRVRMREPEPVEDLAIGNLLEIDLEEKEPISWEEKLIAVKMQTKCMNDSSNKFHSNKLMKNQQHHRHEEEPIFKKRLNFYDLAEFQYNSGMLTSDMNRNNPKSTDFNEGQYWSSRINWIQQKKEQSNQTQRNNKIFFGFQGARNKETKGGQRYEVDDKNKKEQYKNNMICSLLHQEQNLAKVKSNYERVCSSLGDHKRNGSNTSHLLRKISKNIKPTNTNKDQNQNKINSLLRLNMRETLKKLYLKNHHEENTNVNSPFKHSEQERSIIVRQMLNNLQHLKGNQINIKQVSENHNKKINSVYHQQTPFLPHSLKKPQKKRSRVINLNLQAQKIYNQKITNRWNGKKPIILYKMQ